MTDLLTKFAQMQCQKATDEQARLAGGLQKLRYGGCEDVGYSVRVTQALYEEKVVVANYWAKVGERLHKP